MSQNQPGLPPMLYIPCEKPPTEGDESLSIAFYQTLDQRMALLAYSALDRLVGACGSRQPWALVPTEKLQEVYEAQPFDTLLLDEPLPSELRRDEERLRE